MIEIAAVLAMLAVSVIMATFGAVLIVRLVMVDSELRRRTVLAAVSGPGSILAPLMAFALSEDREWISILLGLGIVMAVAILALGWPIAHFATRKLDKISQFDLETFE